VATQNVGSTIVEVAREHAVGPQKVSRCQLLLLHRMHRWERLHCQKDRLLNSSRRYRRVQTCHYRVSLLLRLLHRHHPLVNCSRSITEPTNCACVITLLHLQHLHI